MCYTCNNLDANIGAPNEIPVTTQFVHECDFSSAEAFVKPLNFWEMVRIHNKLCFGEKNAAFTLVMFPWVCTSVQLPPRWSVLTLYAVSNCGSFAKCFCHQCETHWKLFITIARLFEIWKLVMEINVHRNIHCVSEVKVSIKVTRHRSCLWITYTMKRLIYI